MYLCLQETLLCLNRWRVNSSFSFIGYMNSKDDLFPSLHFICLWRFRYLCVCVTMCICVCVYIFGCRLSAGILDKGVLYLFHISMNNPRLYPRMQFSKYLFPCQGKTHIWENWSNVACEPKQRATERVAVCRFSLLSWRKLCLYRVSVVRVCYRMLRIEFGGSAICEIVLPFCTFSRLMK